MCLKSFDVKFVSQGLGFGCFFSTLYSKSFILKIFFNFVIILLDFSLMILSLCPESFVFVQIYVLRLSFCNFVMKFVS